MKSGMSLSFRDGGDRTVQLEFNNYCLWFMESWIMDCMPVLSQTTLELTFNTSEAESIGDDVVLIASEAVSAVTRLSGASRQFRSAMTLICC